MPKRRIVFGIGAGIMFTCLAFYFIYTMRLDNFKNELEIAVNNALVSDEDIIKRAGELGMVFIPENSAETPKPTPEQKPSPSPVPTPEPIPTPESTPESSFTPESNSVQEPDSARESDSEPETMPDETPLPTVRPEAVKIVIPGGVTATEITRILERAGIIESADDFKQLLIDKGYTVRMAAGTFYLVPGTDLETLAEALVRKKTSNKPADTGGEQ